MKNYKICCIFLVCLSCWNSSFAQCTSVVGDTVYVTSTNNVTGSLRNAINCVNDVANSIRFIHFNIPGAGVKTISPTGAAPLPTITKNNVVIDARTQPGWSLGNVVITPGAFGNNNHALRIQSNDVEVYGLTISGFTDTSTGSGIFLTASNALIEENAFIGNNYGIRTDFGLSFTANDNFIGVDPVTDAANGNLVAGISIGSSTGSFEINRNTIAFNPRGVVSTGDFATVLVNENSFYCNTLQGIDRGIFTAPGFTLTNATTRTISGDGTNGHLIEVFSYDLTDCPSPTPCQGKTLIGSTIVSGGNWTLDVADGVLQEGDEVTATATVGGNNTTEFTACRTVVCSSESINFSNVVHACAGGSTGSATANVSIPGNFTYDWSNGQTGATAINLAPATYTVTATDASFCVISNNITILSLTAPDVNPFANDPLCVGENLLLDANANNGTPAYTYEWTGPDNFTSNDEMPSIINVDIADEGTFLVTVTDQNLCQANGSVFVEVNELPTFNLTPQDISCFGENDGRIELNPIIIEVPESYEWSNGFFTQNIDELGPGTYTVTLTDVNNCEAIESASITEPPVLVLSNLLPSSPSSLGGNDGSLMFDINGGTAPYAYSWSGPVNGDSNQPMAGMVTINNLPAGHYTLAMTDANMCMLTQNFTIVAFGGCMMSISTSEVNNISCAGAMDGSINITIVNGSAPITYNWDHGAMTEDISGLSPANYALTATDATNCEVTFSASITEPPVLVLSNLLPSSPSSLGANDGSLMFDINGGTAPYAYSWSGPVNGDSNQPMAGAVTINNLPAGDYTLAVTDANMCMLTQNFTIPAFGGCTFAIEDTAVMDVNCSGQAEGSISITTINGTEPLSYQWTSNNMSGDGSGNTINNLQQGAYDITLTDQGGCFVTVSLSVNTDNNPSGLLNFIQGEEELCQGETLLLSTNVINNPDIIYYWRVPNGDTIPSMTANLLIENVQITDAGDYYVFAQDGFCIIDETGPFNLNVLGLPPGEQIYAGMDTVICDNQLLLNAAPVTQGIGRWVIPDGVNINQLDINNPLVTNLQDGDNQFIWMVNTVACGNIGSDTVNVLVVTGLQAEDDFFTLEQANSEIFMAVLKNDGFPDNSEFTLSALTQPQFGSLVTLDNGFQYFETEGQRGTVTFDYQVCFSDTSCPMSCATVTVTIEVLNLPYLPEGFTPNEDGLNDFLEVRGYSGGGNISMKISITNRWGDIVYYSKNYLLESPWNGHNRNNSNPLPEGTYYAWMEIEVDGEIYQQTQPIYLIK